jgi:conjugal transfer ATP-binding protein TraC
VAGQLARRHVRLQSTLGHDAGEGRPADPDLVAAEEQTLHLRRALARGLEKPFLASLYVLLRGTSRVELDARTRAAQDVVTTLGGRLAIARLQQEAGLHACLPEGQDALGLRHPLETSSLVTAYPFPPAGLDTPGGVPLGFDRRTLQPVSLDVFDDRVCRNANVVVFGPGGVGKSYAVKLWLLRALLLDDATDVLVVDPKHEYANLVDAVGDQARFVRLAAASRHRVNPFDLPPPGPRQPPGEVLGDHIQQVLGLLDVLLAEPGGRLGRRARGRLDRALSEAYQRAGITADPATHDAAPPTLGDLDLSDGDEVSAALAELLRPFTEGSLAGGLLHGQTSIDLDRRLTVFGLLDLAEESWPVAMHLLASWVWTAVRRRPGRQRLFIVDEVLRLLRQPAGAAFLESLARLARAAGLGLVAISQDVRVVLDDEHGRTIAENAAAALLLGQSPETIRPLAEAFELSADEQADLLAIGAGRDAGGGSSGDRRGEGLLLAAGQRIWLKPVASPGEHKLATTAFRELAGLRPIDGTMEDQR